MSNLSEQEQSTMHSNFVPHTQQRPRSMIEDCKLIPHSYRATARSSLVNSSAPISTFNQSFLMPKSTNNDFADASKLAFEDKSFFAVPVSPSRRTISRSNSPSTKENHVLVTSDRITRNDVLCGRGAGSNAHSGNITFRALVGQLHHTYLNAKPLDKTNISKGLVRKITDQGGRFLKQSKKKDINGKSRFWYDIGFNAAREKTCQALRERAPSTFDLPKQAFTPSTTSSQIVPDPTAGRQTAVTIDGVQVNDHDVLLGRGGVTNAHLGNKKYRSLVRRWQRDYLATAKLKKASIAQLIVDTIQNEGGRFLTEKKGVWVAISKDKAREKTSQALREKAPELRRIYDVARELVVKKAAEKRRAQQREHQLKVRGYFC